MTEISTITETANATIYGGLAAYGSDALEKEDPWIVFLIGFVVSACSAFLLVSCVFCCCYGRKARAGEDDQGPPFDDAEPQYEPRGRTKDRGTQAGGTQSNATTTAATTAAAATINAADTHTEAPEASETAAEESQDPPGEPSADHLRLIEENESLKDEVERLKKYDHNPLLRQCNDLKLKLAGANAELKRRPALTSTAAAATTASPDTPDLAEENKSLKDEVERLKEFERTCNKANTTHRMDLTKEVSNLTRRLLASQQSEQALRSQLAQPSTPDPNLQWTMDQIFEQNDLLKARNAELENAQKELEECQAARKHLETQNEWLDKDSLDTRDMNMSFQQANKELQQKVIDLEAELKALKDKSDDHNGHDTQTPSDSQNTINALRAEVKKLKDTLDQQKEDCDVEKKKLSDGMYEYKHLFKQCDEDFRKLDQEKQNLVDIISALEEAQKKTDHELDECRKHGKTLEAENESLTQALASLKESTGLSLNDRNNELAKCVKKGKEIERDLRESRKRVETLEAENASLTQQLATLEESTKESANAKDRKLAECEQHGKLLAQELEGCRQHGAALTAQNESLTQQLGMKELTEKSSDEVERKLAACEEHGKQLQIENEALKQELSALKGAQLLSQLKGSQPEPNWNDQVSELQAALTKGQGLGTQKRAEATQEDSDGSDDSDDSDEQIIVESSEPVEPVKPVEPVEPVKPVEPVEAPKTVPGRVIKPLRKRGGRTQSEREALAKEMTGDKIFAEKAEKARWTDWTEQKEAEEAEKAAKIEKPEQQLKDKLEACLADKKKYSSKAMNLEVEKQILAQQLAETQEKLQNAESKLQAIQSSQQGSSASEDALKKEVQRLEGELSKARKEHEDTINEWIKEYEKLSNANDKLKLKQPELKELQRQLKSAQEKQKQAESNLEDCNKHGKELKQQNDKLVKDNAELKKKATEAAAPKPSESSSQTADEQEKKKTSVEPAPAKAPEMSSSWAKAAIAATIAKGHSLASSSTEEAAAPSTSTGASSGRTASNPFAGINMNPTKGTDSDDSSAEWEDDNGDSDGETLSGDGDENASDDANSPDANKPSAGPPVASTPMQQEPAAIAASSNQTDTASQQSEPPAEFPVNFTSGFSWGDDAHETFGNETTTAAPGSAPASPGAAVEPTTTPRPSLPPLNTTAATERNEPKTKDQQAKPSASNASAPLSQSDRLAKAEAEFAERSASLHKGSPTWELLMAVKEDIFKKYGAPLPANHGERPRPSSSPAPPSSTESTPPKNEKTTNETKTTGVEASRWAPSGNNATTAPPNAANPPTAPTGPQQSSQELDANSNIRNDASRFQGERSSLFNSIYATASDNEAEPAPEMNRPRQPSAGNNTHGRRASGQGNDRRGSGQDNGRGNGSRGGRGRGRGRGGEHEGGRDGRRSSGADGGRGGRGGIKKPGGRK